jgi:nitrite reductase/ring-hydroxylating ferredoxin subunit
MNIISIPSACKTAEVPASHGLKVKLPGVTVAIFKTEDRYVVMKNACAHQGGDLSSNRSCMQYNSTYSQHVVGDIEEYEGLTCIKCPQHQYKFDLKTGKRVLQGGELSTSPLPFYIESDSFSSRTDSKKVSLQGCK